MIINKILFFFVTILLLSVNASSSEALLQEEVFVESPTDTDRDGNPDRIYVKISRPSTSKKLSSIFTISPYNLGGNNVRYHSTDVDILPQDEKLINKNKNSSSKTGFLSKSKSSLIHIESAIQYAKITADSLGTGRSTGCPTVGDQAETLAAKAVIDWLGGRARAFSRSGKEVVANWSSGKVGMIGVSYNGTLPTMVATTGVEGLKAIVPIAAISNWYDYYRANGLVVNPGGYVGEDIDTLGKYIVRKNACQDSISVLTAEMGRNTGDFTQFWQDRDYLPLVKNIKAATFIIHGQSDWNVKQKHAADLWTALNGVAPRKVFFHRGGHSYPSSHSTRQKVQKWFDHYIEGIDNGIDKASKVEVELRNGQLISQDKWPHENAQREVFFFNPNNELTAEDSQTHQMSFKDFGKSTSIKTLASQSSSYNGKRLLFLDQPLKSDMLLSGSPKITLNLAVINRKAANITVAVVEYGRFSSARIVTRGWADPQNHSDFTSSEFLNPGQFYKMTFSLEPKQYKFTKGNRIGVLIASTDYDYTFRPSTGTELKLNFSEESFIEMFLSTDY